jgi:hypothetical protein
MVGNIALNGVPAYNGGNLPKPVTAIIAYTAKQLIHLNFLQPL